MPQLVKVIDGLAIASVKTVQDLDVASVAALLGIDNTAGAAGGPFTFVQGKQSSYGTTSVTADADITAGNLLVCAVVTENSGSATAVAEDGGGAFTALTETRTSGNCALKFFYRLAATGGQPTVTVTTTGTVTGVTLSLAEYSYTGTASYVASAQASNDSSLTPATPNVTNSGSNRLNVVCLEEVEFATITVGTAITIGGAAATQFPATPVLHMVLAYNTANLSAQNATAGFGVSTGYNMGIACFRTNG